MGNEYQIVNESSQQHLLLNLTEMTDDENRMSEILEKGKCIFNGLFTFWHIWHIHIPRCSVDFISL